MNNITSLTEAIKVQSQYLKNCRLKKEITLDQMVKRTAVRKSYLKAIEDGCLHRFMAKAYTMGFIGIYGKIVDANITEISRLYKSYYKQTDDKENFMSSIFENQHAANRSFNQNDVIIAIGAIVLLFCTYYLATIFKLI
ncbi:helix-turn-helix domain-containing protein [Chlamydiia bacterium]|nr:helix-turn-helix domain-containing protein [Chlamydiia bacterium]